MHGGTFFPFPSDHNISSGGLFQSPIIMKCAREDQASCLSLRNENVNYSAVRMLQLHPPIIRLFRFDFVPHLNPLVPELF